MTEVVRFGELKIVKLTHLYYMTLLDKWVKKAIHEIFSHKILRRLLLRSEKDGLHACFSAL